MGASQHGDSSRPREAGSIVATLEPLAEAEVDSPLGDLGMPAAQQISRPWQAADLSEARCLYFTANTSQVRDTMQ